MVAATVYGDSMGVIIRCLMLAALVGFPHACLALIPQVLNSVSFVGRTRDAKVAPQSFGSIPHQLIHLKSEMKKSTYLKMGLFEDIGSFLTNRGDDFTKLDAMDDAFGPGPVVLFYGCPPGLSDEELRDMISDGAPKATKASCSGEVPFCRIGPKGDNNQKIMSCSVFEALELAADGKYDDNQAVEDALLPCPIIYFSGFTNAEMMETYRIIAKEVYDETGGRANAACAKAVPPAMAKTLERVFDEIKGDHADAVEMNLH